MIFVSSTVPLNKIPASKEEIYKMDWFLFSATIRNKDYLKDNELYGICYQLHLYPYFYSRKLYNYLMSDHYYYKSHLYNTMQNSAKLTSMKKVKHCNEIINWDEEVINEENHIFTDSDIEKMFDFFKENNFKRNSICEFILGYEKQNGE